MELEDQIRNALARTEPSSGFAAQVAAKAARSKGPVSGTRIRTWTAVAAIAASLAVGVLGLEGLRERRERERGEAARSQVLQAVHLTSNKLQQIQRKVKGIEE